MQNSIQSKWNKIIIIHIAYDKRNVGFPDNQEFTYDPWIGYYPFLDDIWWGLNSEMDANVESCKRTWSAVDRPPDTNTNILLNEHLTVMYNTALYESSSWNNLC